MENNLFNINEKKLIGSISLLLAIRTLAVSLIIPILSIYAIEISGSTSSLAGVAIGIFGISQTLLQIPMGFLSDKWGRRQTVILGLSIYLFGTILSGFSRNIYHLIVARMISGAGGVTGVTIAWLTDGIDKGKRNSALSYVGISIGTAVIIGFTLSPIIAGRLGLPILFYISGALISFLLLYIVCFIEDNHYKYNLNINFNKKSISAILKNRDIIRLNLTGLIESLSLTSIFFIMPLLIKNEIGIINMWKIYIPVSVVGTIFMYYFAQKADKNGTVNIALIAILFSIIGVILPILFDDFYSIITSFILVYSGHCILSPILFAAVSKYPNKQLRGSAIGTINTFQFVGTSIGGFMSGIIYEYNYRYMFFVLAIFLCISFFSMHSFRDFKSEDCS